MWGAPRSGTTLLYELIARHPEVACPRDNDGKPREGTGFWWRAFGEHRGPMGAADYTAEGEHRIRKEYQELLVAQGRTRLLDKTPFMTIWVPLVEKVFPDAFHLHIYRDGRAVVNSILNKLRFSKKEKDRAFREERMVYGPVAPAGEPLLSMPQAQRHARQWAALVQTGREVGHRLGRRYMELSYERLVEDPRTVLAAVLEHAQLPCDGSFLTAAYPEVMSNRNTKWQSPSQERWSDGFSAGRAYKEEDLPYLEEMTPLLKELGYTPSGVG